MWNFSSHIQQRIKDRKITATEILTIVNGAADVLVVPSDKDHECDLYFGKIENKYIMVVVNRDTKTLVTTRNMRKNEKKIFDEEIKNEKEKD